MLPNKKPELKEGEVWLQGRGHCPEFIVYSTTIKKIVSRHKFSSQRAEEPTDGVFARKLWHRIFVYKIKEKWFIDVDANRFEITENVRIIFQDTGFFRKFQLIESGKVLFSTTYPFGINSTKREELHSGYQDVFRQAYHHLKTKNIPEGAHKDIYQLKEGELWLNGLSDDKGYIVYSMNSRQVVYRLPNYSDWDRNHYEGVFSEGWIRKIYFFKYKNKFFLDIGKRRVNITSESKIKLLQNPFYRRFLIIQKGKIIVSIRYPFQLNPLDWFLDYPDMGDPYHHIFEDFERGDFKLAK